MKKITIIGFLIGLIFFLFLFSIGRAGLFDKEKEIKDEYLEKLFTPNIPHESVKVVEGSKDIRFIVIKTKEKISNSTLNEYNALLLSRGVNIYGTFHYGYFSWQQTVTDYAITITRKVEGEPDTIEISESIVKDFKKEPVVAASAKGKEIRIAIEKDFGKKWKKIKIVPDKEPNVPEPKIGRYPGSKLIKIIKWPSSDKSWIYVVKASIKDVAYFFKNHLEKKLKEKASGSTYWEKEVENSSRYRYPLEIFGIKTVGLYVNFSQTHSKFRLEQSNDPHLSEYVWIEYELRKGFLGEE